MHSLIRPIFRAGYGETSSNLPTSIMANPFAAFCSFVAVPPDTELHGLAEQWLASTPRRKCMESTHPGLACGFITVCTGGVALERNSNKVKFSNEGERKRRLFRE